MWPRMGYLMQCARVVISGLFNTANEISPGVWQYVASAGEYGYPARAAFNKTCNTLPITWQDSIGSVEDTTDDELIGDSLSSNRNAS